MITCKEELYGTCFVIERREDAALLEAKCIELGIDKARWYGCNYDGGISIGMISKDLETAYSKKLVFSARSQSSETMTEFCDLKRLVLEDLEPQTKEVEWVNGLPPVGVECEMIFQGKGKLITPLYFTDFVDGLVLFYECSVHSFD